MLTIIATLDQEIAGLRRELLRRHVSGNGRRGMGLSQLPLRLQVVGVGREQAEARVRALLARTSGLTSPSPSLMERGTGGEAIIDGPPDGLLLLGFAGAVDPTLRVGELALPTRYYLAEQDAFPAYSSTAKGVEDALRLTAAGVRYLESDSRMWPQAAAALSDAALPWTKLDSLTVSQLVTTPEAKLALNRRYPGGVLNMEDYWVAAAARDAGVPFLSVRAILDTARQPLPSYLLELANGSSRGVQSGALTAVRIATVTPWRAPTLLRLATQMRLAQARLTSFALSFITRWYGINLMMPDVKTNHGLSSPLRLG